MEGYKKKPVLISVFSILYLLNPVGNMLFIIFMNQGTEPGYVVYTLYKQIAQGNILVAVNVFFWISSLPLAYGLYKVRLWAWYYFIIHSVGMFILSMVGFSGIQFTVGSLINIIFLIPIGYFIQHEIRAPYFNPRIRWWEQSPRFQHETRVYIQNRAYWTYDLSETGAFIVKDKDSPLGVEPGTKFFPVELHLGDEVVKCSAEIIWFAHKEIDHIEGWGVKFGKLNIKDKMMIKKYLKGLKAGGTEEKR